MSEGSGGLPLHVRVADELSRRLPGPPEVLLVLGSGLGSVADAVEAPVKIPFRELPGFPETGVPGHAGAFVGGRLGGRPVLVQAGRFHFYEGFPSRLVLAPLRAAARLGIRGVLLTNAAGGIRADLTPGSLLLIEDHLDLMSRSPLAGPPVEGEERFPDMSAPYDPELQEFALDTASRLEIPLSRGTYAAVLGPSYETPAEVRMLRALGADAVGMSTVPEVVAARASGLRVLAFSFISNRATGLDEVPLSHEEVLAAGKGGARTLGRLLEALVGGVPL